MNIIKLRVNLDEARQPIGTHQVHMQLSAWADQHEKVGGLFRASFEIEMLRGCRQELRDGSVAYAFEIDNEKAGQLRQALTAAFFSPAAN